MIDFVTRQSEVLVLRDNQPYFHFTRKDVLEEHTLYLISILNSEARRYDDSVLTPTEEDQFIDLQDFVKDMAKKKI